MANDKRTLAELRQEIDRIDDQMHDLLMARAALTSAIQAAKGKGQPVLRPGREAAILRRLMERHQGPFPKAIVARMWREIISASAALQGPVKLAALASDGDGRFIAAAREHYGALTPIRSFDTPTGVLRALANGTVSLGILPLPTAEDRQAWWPALADQTSTQIVARLPFVPLGGPEALVIAEAPAEASGSDRSYLVLESQPDISRSSLTRALKAADLTPCSALVFEEEERWRHLVEVEGFVEAADPRLARLLEKDAFRQARSIGAFARPLEAKDLKEKL